MRAVATVFITALIVAGLLFVARGGRLAPVFVPGVSTLIEDGHYERAEIAARKQLDEARAAYGMGSLESAQAIDDLVRALYANGRSASDETLGLAEEDALRHRHLAPARPDRLVNALIHLGQVQTDRAEYKPAIDTLKESVTLAERTYGHEHPRLAPALTTLAATYLESRAYGQAWPLLERSLRLTTRDAPGSDEVTRQTLEAMVAIAQRQGNYTEARVLLDQALAIKLRWATEHPARINGLNLLALQLWFEGQLTESKITSRRAVALAEQTLRFEDPRIAGTLRVLAATLWGLGELSEAHALSSQALGIAQRSLGAHHPEVAAYWNDLGNVSLEMGAYADARKQFVEALGLAESMLGAGHEWIPNFMHNLALVDASLGDFDAARREEIKTTALWEQALGHDHPFVAVSLTELADVLRQQGAPGEARPLLMRALAIRERRLGRNHRDTVATTADLAATLAALGDRRTAREMADRAIKIWEATDTPDSPALAAVLELYANLQMSDRRFASAQQYFERALAVRTRALGPTHPLVADVMVRLASVRAALGQDADGMATAIAAENIAREHLRLMLRHLPERESLNYAASRPKGLDVILSLVTNRQNTAGALDALIRSRALVLDEMAARRRLDPPDSNVAALQANLVTAQQRLANVLVRGPRESAPDRYLALVQDAQRMKDDSERALAERSAAYRVERTVAQQGLRDIQHAVPPDGVLVSFVRFDRIVKGTQVVPSYLAFVTHADRPPIAVPLMRAHAIDVRVERWRTAIRAAAAEPSKRTSWQLRRAGLALRSAIWDPLIPFLGGAETVFVVPDGSLNLVSFAGLPGYRHEYLLEDSYAIHYLSSERDLVARYAPSRQTRLLAIGGVSFDEALAAKPSTSGVLPSTRATDVPCDAFERRRFPPLDATLEEVTAISHAWDAAVSAPDATARLLLARDADEATFKRQAPHYRVLHLATHGFFLNGPCLGGLDRTRSVSGLVGASKALERNEVKRTGAEGRPLRLSGLALAGANRRTSVDTADDDGILTAEEVAALDLREVEWAVLSACDTGLGQVQNGEGVLGLRRSFEVAGVHTVIMSLWPVEDQAARQWMIALYDSRLKRHRSTSAAMRDASLAVLEARRTRSESTTPFFWAEFVAAGDWR